MRTGLARLGNDDESVPFSLELPRIYQVSQIIVLEQGGVSKDAGGGGGVWLCRV